MNARILAVDNACVRSPYLVPKVRLQRDIRGAYVEVFETQSRVQPYLTVHDIEFEVGSDLRDTRYALKIGCLYFPLWLLFPCFSPAPCRYFVNSKAERCQIRGIMDRPIKRPLRFAPLLGG